MQVCHYILTVLRRRPLQMIVVGSVIQEVEESDQLVRLLACSNTKKERVIQVTCSTIGFTYTPSCRSPQRHIIAPSPAISICLTINLLYCRIPPSITPHPIIIIIILQWSLYSCVHYQLSAPTSVIVCGSLCTYYYRLHMNRSICVHYMCHTTTLPSQEQSNQGSNDVISAPLPLIAIEILPQMMDSGGESSMINFSQLIWFVVSWPSLTLR